MGENFLKSEPISVFLFSWHNSTGPWSGAHHPARPLCRTGYIGDTLEQLELE